MNAEKVPSALTRFIECAMPDAFTDSAMDSPVSARHPVIVPSYCSTALMRSAALHIANSLCSMASRPQNRTSKEATGICQALCTLLVTAAAQTSRHRKTRIPAHDTFPTEEYGPERLKQLHQREQEEDAHLRRCSATCLNALSFFLSDANASHPSADKPGSTAVSVTVSSEGNKAPADHPAPPPLHEHPTIVQLLISYNVLDTIKLVSTLSVSEARLAAFRVISMLSEWPIALCAAVDANISDILVCLFFVLRMRCIAFRLLCAYSSISCCYG